MRLVVRIAQGTSHTQLRDSEHVLAMRWLVSIIPLGMTVAMVVFFVPEVSNMLSLLMTDLLITRPDNFQSRGSGTSIEVCQRRKQYQDIDVREPRRRKRRP